MSSKNKSVIYSILTVSLLGVVAKLTGLLREGVNASCFGTTAEMDVYSMLSLYVGVLFIFFASSLSTAYSPTYIKYLQQKGEAEAAKQFSYMLNQYVVFSLLLYAVLYFLSPYISEYVNGKIPNINIDRITFYSRVLFSAIITGGMNRMLVSALNGLQNYGWMQTTQIINNIITIIFAFFLGSIYGIVTLVIAYVVCYFIQTILLLFVFFRGERKYVFSLGKVTGEKLEAWKSVIPVYLGTQTYLLGLTIDRTIGISLGIEGVASSLNYAGLLFGYIVTVFSSPINTVFGTEMVRRYFKEGSESLAVNIRNIINHQSFILFPLSFFLFACTQDFVTIVLQRGKFDLYSVQLTSKAFCMYALAAPFFAMRSLFTSVFIMLGNKTIPMMAGIFYLFINLVFSKTLSLSFGILGITMGAFCAMFFSMFLEFLFIKKNYLKSHILLGSDFYKIIIVSLFCAIVSYFVRTFTQESLCVYLRFLISGVLFITLYLFGLKLLKCKELLFVSERIMKKVRKVTIKSDVLQK